MNAGLGISYCSNASHSVMNSARTQSSLDDLETLAFSQDEAGCRNTNVVERDMSVTVRSIIVSKD